MSGKTSYLAGLSAEESVARHYEGSGHRVIGRRWRGQGGELDLIVEKADDTIFIEVKKSATHGQAAAALGGRQIARLFAAAGEFMGSLPNGMLSSVRFDVALVDGSGQIDILENALAA
ncbi:MAG: YraN family protein [Pseudomonadota bacterium]